MTWCLIKNRNNFTLPTAGLGSDCYELHRKIAKETEEKSDDGDGREKNEEEDVET
jgi:hypothetical protein